MKTETYFEAVFHFPHDRRQVAFSSRAKTELGAVRKFGHDRNVKIYRVTDGRRTLVRGFGK